MALRIWLDVAYREKDQAKAAGARWDPQERRWYAPHPGIRALDRWLPTAPPPASAPVAEPGPSWSNDPVVLLRDATQTEPLPWAVRAPFGWFCHMCDSTCNAGEIQMAKIQTRWLHRPTIITQPIEWRHHLQRREDVDWRLLVHITQVLEKTLAPRTAIRWNPRTQRLDTITGPIRDWRDLRDRQKQRP
ncbi:DUF5710 domain-containing protein [Ornithinimicrobium sufpigmenti]|uniref:DUF5710 domain-containing protein n=1 Tax=Ornithinimicrobium sufpigmenti TaxID=2508882 RepID=UPI00192D609A|nr:MULTISPECIES: DUF5710 domain-containing protein [unclassified Ornithinimicrobium]